MKKIITFLMALCLIAPAAMAQVQTLPALTPKQEKMCNKNAKNKAKELKKQGYQNMGSLPLEDALYKHYAKIELGNVEQEGHGVSKSKNMGRQMCISSAMAEYASKELSQLSGRTFQDAQGNEIDPTSDENFSRFFAAFERLTQSEIKGDLQESLTVCKQLPDGTYDFQMFMVYDPSKASSSRQKALKNAIAESKLAQEYADQLSDFINQ